MKSYGIMRRRDEYFCQIANETARKSAMNHKHGCVIVYKDKEIVAHGINHDVCTMNDIKSIHAEVNAINQLRKLMRTNKEKNYIQNCKLYVVRVGSPHMNFPLKNSKPCLHCTQSIFKMGIPKVYYSTDDDFYAAFNMYAQPPQGKQKPSLQGRPLSAIQPASQGRPQPALSQGRPLSPPSHNKQGRPITPPILPTCTIS